MRAPATLALGSFKIETNDSGYVNLNGILKIAIAKPMSDWIKLKSVQKQVEKFAAELKVPSHNLSYAGSCKKGNCTWARPEYAVFVAGMLNEDLKKLIVKQLAELKKDEKKEDEKAAESENEDSENELDEEENDEKSEEKDGDGVNDDGDGDANVGGDGDANVGGDGDANVGGDGDGVNVGGDGDGVKSDCSQIFSYAILNSSIEMRTVNKNGNTWFVAKDVCGILDLKNVSQALEQLDNGEKDHAFIELTDSIGDISTTYIANRIRKMLVISESGLYALISISRKAEAKKFRIWVTSEVLVTKSIGIYDIWFYATEIRKSQIYAKETMTM